MWALAWTFMCIVSPTGSSGTNHLRKSPRRPGERMVDDHSFIGRLAPSLEPVRPLGNMQTQPTVVAAHRVSQGDKPPPCWVWSGWLVKIESWKSRASTRTRTLSSYPEETRRTLTGSESSLPKWPHPLPVRFHPSSDSFVMNPKQPH